MKYGCENLFKKLNSVILCKPINYDIITPINPWQEKWKGRVNKELAIKQHENFIETLERERITCHFLNPIEGKTYQVWTRDIGAVTSKGVIVGNPRKDIRKGEEKSLVEFCNKNNIPILLEVKDESFESGDIFFVDESNCLIGLGPRTTSKVAEKIKSLLPIENFYMITHTSPHHLDTVFGLLTKNIAVCFKESISYELNKFLKDKRIIYVSEDDFKKMATNFLVLKENKILTSEWSHDFNKKLEKEGIDVIEIDIFELQKSGGSVRCLTLPLFRS